jgi:endoglucanase
VRGSLEKAAKWSREHDRPIFLGAFGSFSKADIESRASWTRFVATEARRLGFSWAYWEFCSEFGVYDPQAKAWREQFKQALRTSNTE